MNLFRQVATQSGPKLFLTRPGPGSFPGLHGLCRKVPLYYKMYMVCIGVIPSHESGLSGLICEYNKHSFIILLFLLSTSEVWSLEIWDMMKFIGSIS